MKTTLFNPEKSFLHLGIVWFAVLVLLVLSLIISGIIIYYSPLTLDLSSDGFNYFVSVFRFPLGILTLIIPIVALLAANHRSEQTKEQIRITGIQNNFANYFKHLEEFIKHLEKQPKPKDIAGGRYIHKMIYPNSQFGNYEINKVLIDAWESSKSLTLELFNNYPTDYMKGIGEEKLDEYISNVMTLTSHLHEEGHDSKENYKRGSPCVLTLNADSHYYGTYLSQSLGLIQSMINSITIIDKLCQFSVDYESLLDDELRKKFILHDYHVTTQEDLDVTFDNPFEITQNFEQSNKKFILFLKDTCNVE